MSDEPYIGKIVKCLALTFDEDSSTYFNQGEFFRYKTDSLFYVLGIKQKEYNNIKDFFYIFKPLNNDENGHNSDKKLVWNTLLYVGSYHNDLYMEIVE